MYLHGAPVFGKERHSTQDQLTAWAKLAGRPVPTMVAVSYPKVLIPVASRNR